MLSFVYALLVKDVTAAAVAAGLDPYVGVYHRPGFGRPALALDLAEEFRPLIGDSTVMMAINNGELGSDDFISRAGGVSLTDKGRRKTIAAYERRMSSELTHPLLLQGQLPPQPCEIRRGCSLLCLSAGSCLPTAP